MGYNNDFYGEFRINKPLDAETKALLKKIYDQGDNQAPVSKYNQNSCGWIYDEINQSLVWDEGEKFNEYIEWIQYLVEQILMPRGYIVNGGVEWQGEERDDQGRILIEDNNIRIQKAVITYVDED